ncbi:hypothetical protein DSECCO2_446460 [anaerobic digester metagenome]
MLLKIHHLSKMILVKLFAWIFLLVVIYFCGVDFICFRIAQQQIRKEVKTLIRNGLKDEDMISIEITSANAGSIEWVKKGREFVYQGEMYDIVKIGRTKDGVLVKCFLDKKEGRLIERCMKNSLAHRIFQKFRKSFVFLNPGLTEALFLVLPESYSINSFSEVLSPELSVLSPPPRLG